MADEVKLPRLGQGMESGTIVKWLKAEGDQVEKGEPLYELDTDKVTQEVESEASGVLLKIAIKEGEADVGTTIAVIGQQGEDVSAVGVEAAQPVEETAQPVEETAQEEGSPGRAREQERQRGREAAAEQITEVTEPAQGNGAGARPPALRLKPPLPPRRPRQARSSASHSPPSAARSRGASPRRGRRRRSRSR